MSHRRLLMTTGGGTTPGGGGGTLPPDPTLTETRAITAPWTKNINPTPASPTGGKSWQYDPATPIMEDSADLRLVFEGRVDAVTIKVAYRHNSGPWTAVLVDGVDAITTAPGQKHVITDTIAGPFLEGDTVQLRTYVPQGVVAGAGAGGRAVVGSDARFASTWTPTEPFADSGPAPLVFQGTCRAGVKSVGVFGDSIAHQGQWFRDACAANGLTGANYGSPATQFDSRFLDGGIDGITHMLVQYGVNDLNNGYGDGLWARALDCYDYVQSLRPGLPLWQSTPTPMVDTTDAAATLVNQTVDSGLGARRQTWIAFLRDGAPCHPATRAALAVGATGTVIRAGDVGHPLQAVVDIAAAVEHGGSSSPSGKWRVDLGPLAGGGGPNDGIHPSSLGETAMTPPVTAWMGSL